MSHPLDRAHGEAPAAGPSEAAGLRTRWRQRLPAIAWAALVLCVGLGLTALGVHRTARLIHTDARARFERLSERLSAEITRRVTLPLYGLRGARGLFEVNHSVERSEFRAWVLSRDLLREFPGVLGFGFIQPVRRTDLARFVAAERSDGAPDFAVRTSGDSPDLFVVRFIDPLDRNRENLGHDEASEPTRRAAIERAIRTGQATLSGHITLVQDGRRGFLYFLPVYRNGTDPKTPEERTAELVGLVYARIAIDELLAGAMAAADEEIDVEVFDGRESTAGNELVGLDRVPAAAGGGAAVSTTSGEPMFRDVSHIEVGGREWSLKLSTTPRFDAGIDRTAPALVGLGGAAVTVLLAALIWSLGRGRASALALAHDLTNDSVTARIRAESALLEMAALQTVLRRHFIVSVADTAGRITDVNDAFCRISGYSREELLGKDHRIVNSGHHDESFWAEMWQSIRAGRDWRNDVCNRARDGSIYWVDSTIAPFWGADGRIEKFVSIRTDITARRQAEDMLARNSDMLHRTGEMARVGGWELELPSRKLTCSKETCRLLEIDPETPITVEQGIAFFAPEARERITEALQSAIERGEGWDLELPVIAAGGRAIWVRTKSEPVIRDGAVVRLCGAFQDVTEQHRVSTELARRAGEMELLRDAAESASRTKSEFLANMSHEIRTPLTAILGYAELLREDGDLLAAPASRLQTIDTIVGAGQHLLAVINDILDLSKIEAGRMRVESVETPLRELLFEVERLMRSRMESKDVALVVALATPVPDRMMSDPTRLRQILMNLVGNAAKFTQHGSVTVTAGVERPGTEARLVIDVEDTGPGIAPAAAEALFAPFNQADTSVTRPHEGTGLGLAITRRLARLMGGDVTLAWTEPGQGSHFRVELPLVPAAGASDVSSLAAEPAEPRPGERPATAALSGRILLAEDSPVNQRLIALHLGKAGAEVDLAENGLVALEMIDEAAANGRPYDLLLTDMQMPEMDGYTLARSLRERGNTMPIVALTAHAMAEDRQRCIDAGCDDYASKPIHKAALLETCGKWIRKSAGAREEQAAC